MKKIEQSLTYIVAVSLTLVLGCNWLDNKQEQVEQKMKEEFTEHVLAPIAQEAYDLVEEAISPAYDSTAAAEYCAKQRPNPLSPISAGSVSDIGYQQSVLASTPDSLRAHIDAAYFAATDKYLPLRFPFYLDYEGPVLGYARFKIGYCQFSDLPFHNGVFPYREIYELAIADPFLMMSTYDDDRSFMSPSLIDVKHYIVDLAQQRHFEYTDQKEFDAARATMAKSTEPLMRTDDFVKWYGLYRHNP